MSAASFYKKTGRVLKKMGGAQIKNQSPNGIFPFGIGGKMGIISEPYNQFRKPIKYIEKGDCWICISHRPAKCGRGVPQVMRDGIFRTVASYVYSLVYGPFEGKIRHTCGNGMCINPDHVEIVDEEKRKAV